jgi:mevalonate pyrophosphate decarboxylase
MSGYNIVKNYDGQIGHIVSTKNKGYTKCGKNIKKAGMEEIIDTDDVKKICKLCMEDYAEPK